MGLIHHPSPQHINRRKSTLWSLPRRKKPRLRSSSYNAIADYNDDVLTPYPSSSKPLDRVCVAFPGGGLFFYWQAGVIVSVDD
jgi:hypothetical protein